MNHVYRLVFNRALGVIQVVSELATSTPGGRSGPRGSLSPHRLAQACALLLATGLIGMAPTALAATATGTAGGNGGSGGWNSPGTGGASGGAGNAGGDGAINYGAGGTGGGADGSGGTGGRNLWWYSSAGGGGGGGGGIGGNGGFNTPATPGQGGRLSFSGMGGGGGGGGAYYLYGGGGGGGGGGIGVVYASGGSAANTGNILGGAGGAGGAGASYAAGGGGGGGGGAGVVMDSVSGGSFSNIGSIVGGAGGAGGAGAFNGAGGGGGAGGFGLVMNTPSAFTNWGTVSGGNGGLGGSGIRGIGAAGQGGVGIAVTGGANIVNRGTISGGLSGDGSTRAAAIVFTGTGNWFWIDTGSNIVGNLELWANASASIGAWNAGLVLGSNILMGTGSSVLLNSHLAGMAVTGSILGSGSLYLAGSNVLRLSTVDVAFVHQAGENTVLLNASVTTTGSQTFDGQVILDNNLSLASTGGGDINLSSVDGSRALVVNTSGTTRLGNIGQTTVLTSLTTNAGGSTWLNGNITTTGNQFFGDQVSAVNGATATSAAGGITFNSTLLGTGALTLSAWGTVVLNGLTQVGTLTSTSGTFTASTLTADALSVTTTGGAISQTGSFNVSGATSFDAGTSSITLVNAGNDFTGAVNLRGGATMITDSNALTLGSLATGALTVSSHGALDLGSGTIGGNLSATSNNGAVTQSGPLSVTGTSTLNAGSGSITLTNAGNDFTGAVDLTAGGSVALVDRNDLTVSTLTHGANANVSLVAGGTLSLPVGAIDTGTGNLILASNGGSFTTPGALTGNHIDLTGRDGLTLVNDVTGTLVTLDTTNAAIAQTGGALTASTLTGSSGAGNVILTNAGNAIGTITDFSAGNFSLVNNQALAITGALAATGNITLVDTFGITVTGSVSAGGSTFLGAGTSMTIGNGGITGSISGDVVDNGLLAFNRSDDVTFAGALSGSGDLHQIGAGTLALDGDSSAFAGATQVASGTLLVGSSAGNGAVLGGNVSVDSGATLGGHGTIGGDVAVAGGAHLAPGNSIGTLTIAGNLTLAQNAQLDYEFGTPGADFTSPGNGDSVVVGGDLTLNGAVLNVTDAGGMGPGLYRVFSWGGTLTQTNGGLTLGATPGTDLLQLQTLTADQQINLIDSAGLTLNFWNGNGLATANALGGGDGTWSTTAMNWTDANATVSAAMQPQPGFAIFGGAAGTVTVDNRDGAVSATGLQFASDGYTLQGDTLTLVGTGTDAPVIRVGDGSAAGADFTATIDNVIAGSDGLAKTDAGTLVLTGANTFSGGLVIEGGEVSVSSDANLGDAGNTVTFDGGLLQVTGTTFRSTARDLVLGDNGGGFDIADATNVFTVAQALAGSGAFVKAGTGTLVLTGANTFSGGTTIGAGTLQLGDGGTTGSLAGDVVDNGTLAFDRSDSVTFAGTISGTGGLVQQGSGTTILTAGNSFTGGTVIADGTLQLGNGGTSGMIAGNVLNNGVFAFDRSDDVAFAGRISGNGTLLQQGGGTLVLDGDSSAFAGSTDVQSGTLVVGSVAGTGAVLGGDVRIDSGATLAGLGAIGGDVVNDGLLSPGMGIGTLTIHGNYTQTEDGRLAIDVQADGQADRLVVEGNATLDGSALVLAADGNWQPLTEYTILTAGGIVSGTFGSTTSSLVFLDPVLNYDAHAVRLSLQRNDVGFASVGITPNQRAAAGGADTLGFGNAVYDAVTTLDATTAPQAFDALSGELHASVQTALMEDSRYLRVAMRERLDAARADGHGVWVTGWGHWAHDDSNGNAAELRTDGNGMVAGADTAVGDGSRIGVVVGVGRARARVDDRASRADIASRHLGVFGRMALGGLQLQAGMARSSHEIDSRREVAFTGFDESLRGDQDAHTTQAYIDASHDFTVANGTVSPFLDLAHVQVRGEAFAETGGDAALRVDPVHTSRSFATAGVRGAFAFGSAWRLQGSLGWSHTLGGDASPQVRESFVAGSDAFVISGVPIADNAVTVEAGLGYQATPAFRVNASYIGRFASDARDQGAGLTLAWAF